MTMQRRQALERLLAVVTHEPDGAVARRTLSDALHEARVEGSKDLTLLLSCAITMAGGSLAIPAALLAGLDPGGGLVMAEDLRDGSVTVSYHGTLGAAIRSAQTLAAKPPAAGAEPTPSTDYPAANPTESDGAARVRICEAVRALIRRHYDGEIRQRGYGFMETVCGELLAMAIGVAAATVDVGAPTAQERVQGMQAELTARALKYQMLTEQTRSATEEQPEPGDLAPPTPNRTRLH